MSNAPQFVVLEGVDGSGKTALFDLLASYYKTIFSNVPLYAEHHQTRRSGTLGELIFRFHRNRVRYAPSSEKIAPPALQLMHIAGHVDTVLTRITPIFRAHGNVLLDRYWWTTYAYSRPNLSPDQTMKLITPELMFWEPLPKPTVIYVSRRESLKPYQLTPERHRQLDGYYREIMAEQRSIGIKVHELSNDSTLTEAWTSLLGMLDLPFVELDHLQPSR